MSGSPGPHAGTLCQTGLWWCLREPCREIVSRRHACITCDTDSSADAQVAIGEVRRQSEAAEAAGSDVQKAAAEVRKQAEVAEAAGAEARKAAAEVQRQLEKTVAEVLKIKMNVITNKTLFEDKKQKNNI